MAAKSAVARGSPLRIFTEAANVTVYKRRMIKSFLPFFPPHGLIRPGATSADFFMLDAIALRSLLQDAKSIAILGAKDKAGQPVDRVGRYLLDQGYTVYPVHPVRRIVWGLEAFPTLAELPAPVDIIDLFRAPQYCPEHAREVLALPWRPRAFWMQSGIRSPEARELLTAIGVMVVEDACLMVEHARLLEKNMTTHARG